jgi:hypothetical protein
MLNKSKKNCLQSKQVHAQEIKASHCTGKVVREECALCDAQNGMRLQSRLIGIQTARVVSLNHLLRGWPHGRMSGVHSWSLVMF